MNAETSATSPPHRKRRFPTHQTTVYSPTRDRQNSKRYNTPKGPLQHHPAVLALGVGEEDKEARSASRGGASPVRTVTTPPAVVALGGSTSPPPRRPSAGAGAARAASKPEPWCRNCALVRLETLASSRRPGRASRPARTSFLESGLKSRLFAVQHLWIIFRRYLCRITCSGMP